MNCLFFFPRRLNFNHRGIMSEISIQIHFHRRPRDAPMQFQTRRVQGRSIPSIQCLCPAQLGPVFCYYLSCEYKMLLLWWIFHLQCNFHRHTQTPVVMMNAHSLAILKAIYKNMFFLNMVLQYCSFCPVYLCVQGMSKERMMEIRRQNCNPMTMKVTYYKKPVFIHQGYMQWLWDVDGKRYLDLFAGVATVSVGHCHPWGLLLSSAVSHSDDHNENHSCNHCCSYIWHLTSLGTGK